MIKNFISDVWNQILSISFHFLNPHPSFWAEVCILHSKATSCSSLFSGQIWELNLKYKRNIHQQLAQ